MENEADEICIVCGGKEPCSHDFDKMNEQLEFIFQSVEDFTKINPVGRKAAG